MAQYLWLRQLAQRHRNITCVGDDDQSIYSWRGAEVGNILRFEQDFPGAEVVRLERNYRSTGHILGAASGLIAHNRSRHGKTLWTEGDLGERVRIASLWDDQEEARFIGEEIEAYQRQQVALNDVAVLVRAGFQTRAFEERFIQLGLPYRVIGGPRFYERAEIRDAIAYLRLVIQPDDDLALERIVNRPKRGLGEATMQLLRRAARDGGTSLWIAARNLCATDELRPKVRTTISRLLDDIERWRGQGDQMPPRELAEIVLEESGYVQMWQDDRSAEAPGRLENLKELVQALDEFETLPGFLEHVSLVMDNASDPAGDMVTIMTLHAAKGLEFGHLFLPGWEEGLFPNQRAMEEGGTKALEEERRLAYVGITRAKQALTICYAANRRDLQPVGGERAGALRRGAARPAHRVPAAPERARARHERLVRRRPLRRPRARLRPHARGRQGCFDRGQGPGAGDLDPQEQAHPARGPAHLSRQVRLWRGPQGRGQQARDRVREGRHQEGHRQLRRAGMTTLPLWQTRFWVPAAAVDAFLELLDAASVSAFEDPARPERWGLALIQHGEPDLAALRARLAPLLEAWDIKLELELTPVPATDWLARRRKKLSAAADRPLLDPWQPCHRAATAGQRADPARCRPGLRLGRARQHARLPAGDRHPGRAPQAGARSRLRCRHARHRSREDVSRPRGGGRQ